MSRICNEWWLALIPFYATGSVGGGASEIDIQTRSLETKNITQIQTSKATEPTDTVDGNPAKAIGNWGSVPNDV